jgi:hypothetical protein
MTGRVSHPAWPAEAGRQLARAGAVLSHTHAARSLFGGAS